MAINPNSQYPGKITAPDANYPYGSAQNITTTGDGTGTPWEAALLNDIFGFQQALLKSAGIVPSGTPDKVAASEYLQSIVELASGRAYTYNAFGTANVIILLPRANQQAFANLFNGVRLRFTAVNTNTGATVANTVAIKNDLGAALVGGEIITGNEYDLIYNGVNYVLHDQLNKTGGTVTGQIKGITPVAGVDLTTKAYVDSLVMLTKKYTSAQTVMINGSILTFTHGLTVVPEIIRTYIVCITADDGYTVGDVLEVLHGQVQATGSGETNMAVVSTNANIKVLIGNNGITSLNWLTGNGGSLTTSRWKLVVKAFA